MRIPGLKTQTPKRVPLKTQKERLYGKLLKLQIIKKKSVFPPVMTSTDMLVTQ